jgi:hypothetical protein
MPQTKSNDKKNEAAGPQTWGTVFFLFLTGSFAKAINSQLIYTTN